MFTHIDRYIKLTTSLGQSNYSWHLAGERKCVIFDTGCDALPGPVFVFQCVQVFLRVKTHQTRRQMGEIQQLLVLLESEKLQREDQVKQTVRKSQCIHETDIWQHTQTHRYTPLKSSYFKKTLEEMGIWVSCVSTNKPARQHKAVM